MKLRTDSWIAKVARVNEKYISDECSLYRALVWELFVRAARNVVAPTLGLFGIISFFIIWFEFGTYPHLFAFEQNSSAWLMLWEVELGPWLAAPLYISMFIVVMIGSLVPAAAALCLLVFGVFLLWEHVLVKLVRKSAEVTAGKVIVTGIRNWHQGICRRVELINPNMPEGFGVGAKVLIGDIEGTVTKVDSIDHKRGHVEFWLGMNYLAYFHAYGEDDMCTSLYRRISMTDIKVLESAKQ